MNDLEAPIANYKRLKLSLGFTLPEYTYEATNILTPNPEGQDITFISIQEISVKITYEHVTIVGGTYQRFLPSKTRTH